MATVAAEARVGVGTLYRHYPTREALLSALETKSYELSCPPPAAPPRAPGPRSPRGCAYRAAIHEPSLTHNPGDIR